MNAWGRERLLSMKETDTIVTRAMTGATVRCIRTPEIEAYERALSAGASEDEIAQLKRAVRKSRNTDYAARRQSAAGQVAGMIVDEKPAAQLMVEILEEARRIIEEQLPATLAQ